MIRTILSGSSGRMGQTIAQMIAGRDDYTVVAGVDPRATAPDDSAFPTYADLSEVPTSADVVIDFSSPGATEHLVDAAATRGLSVVVATTGLDDKQLEHLARRSSVIPILQAANMSLGINLLRMLVRRAVSVLGDDFDIEIVEKHHRMKKDSPSGTALALAREAADGEVERFVFGREGREAPRGSGEIGIHAVRGGTIVGEHEVIFAGTDEVVTLRHTAYSRTLFATGALKAAAFLVGRAPGLYTMDDVLAEM